jgi:hypothetical protein
VRQRGDVHRGGRQAPREGDRAHRRRRRQHRRLQGQAEGPRLLHGALAGPADRLLPEHEEALQDPRGVRARARQGHKGRVRAHRRVGLQRAGGLPGPGHGPPHPPSRTRPSRSSERRARCTWR